MISDNATPPHSGAVTHHQDQSITCVNFKIRKTIKRVPQFKEINDELLLFDDINFK